MLRYAILPLLALPLAACGGGADGNATSISINADSEDGTVTAKAGADGRVSVKAPGFETSIKLPKFQLDADNFEMNGVNLYPGSTITSLNVDAQDMPGGKDSGVVKVSFDSPADPAKVRDWFQTKLTDAGFTIAPEGLGLAGTTEEGDPFALRLSAAGAGKAKGEITIRDQN